jgi:hypothetical protein
MELLGGRFYFDLECTEESVPKDVYFERTHVVNAENLCTDIVFLHPIPVNYLQSPKALARKVFCEM